MGRLQDEIAELCKKMENNYSNKDVKSLEHDLKSFFDAIKNVYILINVIFTKDQFISKKDEFKQLVANSIKSLKENKALHDKYVSAVEIVRNMNTGIRNVINILTMDDIKLYLNDYITELEIMETIGCIIDEASSCDNDYKHIVMQNEKLLFEFVNGIIASKNNDQINTSTDLVVHVNDDDSDEEDLEKMAQMQNMMLLLQNQIELMKTQKKSKMETPEHKLRKIMDSEYPDFAKFFELLPICKINNNDAFQFIKNHFYESDLTKHSQRIKMYVNPLRSDIMDMLNSLAGYTVGDKNQNIGIDVLNGIAKYWKIVIDSAIKTEIEESVSTIESSGSLSKSMHLN